MDNGKLENIVLALLFSADEPLSVRKLASIVEDASAADINGAIERWRKKFDDEAWSIVLEKVAGGYQLSSHPEYAPFIARLYTGRRKLRLSKAALETLAIIAYKQPITRAEIENVRGVGCGGVVGNLMERSLIRITGKAKVLGSPFLYGTTQEFLEYLGLNSLKDLPSAEELEILLEKEEQATAEAAAVVLDAAARHDENEDAADDRAQALDESLDEDAAPVRGTAAAVIGPELEEPYHRPVGVGRNRDDSDRLETGDTSAHEDFDAPSSSDPDEEANVEKNREDLAEKRED